VGVGRVGWDGGDVGVGWVDCVEVGAELVAVPGGADAGTAATDAAVPGTAVRPDRWAAAGATRAGAGWSAGAGVTCSAGAVVAGLTVVVGATGAAAGTAAFAAGEVAVANVHSNAIRLSRATAARADGRICRRRCGEKWKVPDMTPPAQGLVVVGFRRYAAEVRLIRRIRGGTGRRRGSDLEEKWCGAGNTPVQRDFPFDPIEDFYRRGAYAYRCEPIGFSRRGFTFIER